MKLIRASVTSRFFGSFGLFDLPNVQNEVKVKSVKQREYESACQSLQIGEVVSTNASTNNLAVADFIHVVAVKVQGLVIGKLHLKFYSQHNKVKRTFVALEPQVKKLLCKRTDRIGMSLVDWLGDRSQAVIDQIAKQTISEIEAMAMTTPTVVPGKAKVSPAQKASVRTLPKVETPIQISKEVKEKALGAITGAVERRAKGKVNRGIVVELGNTICNGSDGKFNSFCLKLDVNGTHIPMFGVELERECVQRQVEPGDEIEVIQMGRMPIDANRYKNLYQINVIGKK